MTQVTRLRSAAAANPLAGIDPADLLARLVSGPFPDDLLPEDVGSLTATPWDDGDSDLDGSLGGAIFFEGDPFGSDAGPGIAYIVFPDATLPAARIAAVAADEDSVPLTEAFPYPAVLLDYGDYIVCLVQVGYVLVIGSADGPIAESGATPSAITDDARATAIEMAQAGVVYLERLAGKTPAASPAAR